ncbi:hypothetical protein PVAG01_06961 [Phlyctema vagabunda]|uniref:Carrier domain-containing protein n=1 Tax=Phlyctema vagabunda TaxID=108571 RepID=A0ABR4PBU1_9HELO
MVLGRFTGVEAAAICFCDVRNGEPDATVDVVRLQGVANISQILKDLETSSHSKQHPKNFSLLDLPKALANAALPPLDNVLVLEQETGLHLEDAVPKEMLKDVTFLSLRDSANELSLRLNHETSRISSAHGTNLLESVNKMLNVILDTPHIPIEQIDYLSESDRHQIYQWNEESPKMADECAHEMIARQVVKQPEALAIVSSTEGSFTYGELDELSTRLSHYLVQIGVGPDVIVPLCFEKSAWAIVSLLAVIKAGGALVFLDPSHPMSRIEEILSQVESSFVLISATVGPMWADSHVTSVTVTRKLIDALPTRLNAPTTNVRTSNALYVVFTSGTTGKPKGCIVEHRNFCSGALIHARGSDLGLGSRVSQFASYTFDVSILEMITALIAGACICVPSAQDLSQGLAYVINKFGITWSFLTPSLVRMMSPDDVPSLRTLILGGEALARSDVETWADKLQLINGYGPSECSIAATANPNLSKAQDPANIGRAIGGVSWIVDAEDPDKLVPIGVVGELLLQGPILARGYLNNSSKTAEVFVKDLAWTNDKEYSGMPRRFYKTGDLARYNADGTIHFVGRKDTQIKLRGQRIELSEIEHHLAVNHHIRHAMVILSKTGHCRQKLVAVIDLDLPSTDTNGHTNDDIRMISTSDNDTASIHIQTIQNHLSTVVPSYMMPSIWVAIQRFPLMASGKLNRAKISQWIANMDDATYLSLVGIEDSEVDTSTSTETERLLQEVYSSVLNLRLEQISLDRSFLSLGGDSISAMQVVAKCREKGYGVFIKDILRSKTITALAQRMGDIDQSLAIAPEKFNTPFPLSPVQQMYFAVASGEDGFSHHFNQSFFLQAKYRISEQDVAVAVDAIVSRHSMLRSHFAQDEQGKWFQNIPEQSVDSYLFRMHNIKALGDSEAIIATTHKLIDFRSGPLFAVDLFETEQGEQYIFMVAHHLVVDLVSWRIIMRDLEELIRGNELPSAKPISFQSWLDIQAGIATTNLDPKTVLPFKIPDPRYEYWGMAELPNKVGDTIEEIVSLDLEQTKSLLSGTCHTALATEPIDLLLAALIHSFNSVFRDRETPAIFREGHGREPGSFQIDLSGTVGWFTTMYPLYVETKDDDILEIVRRAKDTRHSVPGNGWPYFASRFLNAEGRQMFGSHNEVEITFDYLGLYQQLEKEDALFSLVPRELHTNAGDVSPDEQRFMLVEITAEVVNGQMQYQFLYNRHMKHGAGISQWISQTRKSLNSALEKLSKMSKEYTLSDFPLLPLTYDELREMTTSSLPKNGISQNDDIEDVYPCTPMQRGLLISQLKKAGSYEYFHTFELTSQSGSPDVNAFAFAWEQVVSRHPALRTQFVESTNPDRLYDQVVHKKITPWIVHLDSSSDEPFSVINHQSSITAFMGRVPHRLTLCITPSKRIFGKLELNHAIIDGASLPVIFNELVLAYENSLPIGPGPLFSDYISYIAQYKVDDSLSYWKNYLTGLEPSRIGFEQPTTVQTELNTVKLDLDIDPESLQDICEQYGVTVSNILQVAWGIVLRQYAGSDDVSFGYMSSGRDASIQEIEGAVGPFLTMLICRMSFDGESSVEEVLERTRDELERSLAAQYCALADIQHVLGFSGQPLFNSVMSVQRRVESDETVAKSLTINLLEEHDPTEYDISINITTSKKNTSIALGYWTSALSVDQANSIAQLFNKIVTTGFTDPNLIPTTLDVLPDADRDQIFTWNKSMPTKFQQCLHEAFDERTTQQPERPAVCGWDGDFNYQELNHAVSRLAAYLQSIGVGPEAMVSLCFEKSSWTVVAMLGVLKAGGTFVPMDPSYPEVIIRSRISEMKSHVLLVSDKFIDRFKGFANEVFGVSRQSISLLPEVVSPIVSKVQPGNLAYVLFTSGSTGKPKAVALEHAAVCTSLAYHGKSMGYNSKSRTFQFSSYTFDACIIDIFTTIYHGGCICVPSETERIGDIAGAINRMEVNIGFLTPSVIQLISPEDVPTLQTIQLGGEPVSDENIKTWADRVRLINGYGPTEAAMISVTGPLSWPRDYQRSIGNPVGCIGWVVDREDHDRLVPIGCVGELLIHGPILARGYLGDPEKTVASFITNPSWLPLSHSGSLERLYKTGDLVRYNPDGSISYVGRKDNQIKIHGQRIELGEVEHALVKEASIEHALAVAPKFGPSKDRLVAVLALKDGVSRAKESTDLRVLSKVARQALADRLAQIKSDLESTMPAQMVPSVWILVESIPLSVAGKIDRVKINKWVDDLSDDIYQDLMELDTQISATKFATPMERNLQSIWSRILNVSIERLDKNRSFFSLGGDSITAMQIVSACRAEKIQVNIQDILQNKTISQLALHASEFEDSQNQVEEEFDIPFPLSEIQQLYFDRVVPNSKDHHFNQGFLLRLIRHVGFLDLSQAIQRLVSHHSMLRARFQVETDGTWSQRVLSSTEPDVYHFGVHEISERGQIVPIVEHMQTSLDIFNGPVFAVDVFNQGADQFLFVVAHHLVVDLVSWRIILQDLTDCIETGQLKSATPVPFQIARGLQEKQTSVEPTTPVGLPSADWTYWGIEAVKNLQADRVEKKISLDATTTEVLLGAANNAFATESYEIILSAIIHAFQETFEGRSTPGVYIEGHGRQIKDTYDFSNTVGWFTTIKSLGLQGQCSSNIEDSIILTKDAWRRVIESNEPHRIGQDETMEVLFNYTGRQQQLEREGALLELDSLNNELEKCSIGGNMKRLALFEIDVTVADNIATISFGYNRLGKHQDLIQLWINRAQSELQELVPRLGSATRKYTLSDFPLLSLRQSDLAELERDRLPALGLSSSDIEDIYPCSPMQQGILLSQMRLPGSYDIQQVSQILPRSGSAVDIARFEAAWQSVVNRHPSLRTIFMKSVSQDAIFDQVVLKDYITKPVLIKAPNASDALQSLQGHPLRLNNVSHPPHSITLCETESGEVFLRFEISHALIDGMSIALIVQDLISAYDRTLIPGSGPLYSNYISYIKRQSSKESLDYWISYLKGAQPCILPVLQGKKSESRASQSFSVPVDSKKLYEYSEEKRVTLANIFRVAWGLVLKTFTGSDQVCFGYLVSGRDLPVEGIQQAVGAFINMIVCQLQITNATKLNLLVQEAHQDFLRSIPYQQTSLAEIQNCLGLKGNALFNTAISLQRTATQEVVDSGVTLSKVSDDDPTEVSTYCLVLFIP